VQGVQKLENMCTAINLDSYRNRSMKGKQPTVYRWIIMEESPITAAEQNR